MKKESNYKQVAKNVYRDGNSYRVRVSVNGVRQSKNFARKKDAMSYRKELWLLQNS